MCAYLLVVLALWTVVLATPSSGMIPTNENLALGGKHSAKALTRPARSVDKKIEIFVSLGKFEVSYCYALIVFLSSDPD